MSARRRVGIRLAAGVVAVAALAVVVAVALPVGLGGRTGYTIVAGTSMHPTLDSGDLVITVRRDTYSVGDVIVYRVPEGEPGAGMKVIHRITGGSGDTGFVTAGDNGRNDDVWRPTKSDIIGSHWRTIPAGGLAMLWLRSPLVAGLVLAALVFHWMLGRRELPSDEPLWTPIDRLTSDAVRVAVDEPRSGLVDLRDTDGPDPSRVPERGVGTGGTVPASVEGIAGLDHPAGLEHGADRRQHHRCIERQGQRFVVASGPGGFAVLRPIALALSPS